jgi:hypothetical protein
MATSGSTDYTVTRSQIINEALANLGAYDPADTVPAEESARAAIRLNLMIKAWMARGANLWRREEHILYNVTGQLSYTYGTDHITKKADVVETTLGADEALGQTTLTVTSSTGMLGGQLDFDAQTANFTNAAVLTGATSGATATITSHTDLGTTGTLSLASDITGVFQDNETITDDNGTPGSATVNRTLYDYVGVKLDDGTIHFSAINSVTDGTTIVIADALPSAASSGNAVYTYSFKATSPQSIMLAYRRDKNNIDTPVTVRSRQSYETLSSKTQTGPLTEIHHDAQLTSQILVWPTGDKSHDKLIMVVQRPVEDFDSTSDNPDYPAEFYQALVWGLSSELSSTYGLPLQERAYLKKLAETEFAIVNTDDIEESSVTFAYDYTGQ